MPEIKVQAYANFYQVRFEYPDLDTKIFAFLTMKDAQDAIELARYVQANDIALTNIKYK